MKVEINILPPAEPVKEVTLTMSLQEASILRHVVGNIGGGYGTDPVKLYLDDSGLLRRAGISSGEIRRTLDKMWSALQPVHQ